MTSKPKTPTASPISPLTATGKAEPMSTDREDRDFYAAYIRANSPGYPYEVPKPGEPQCEADGVREGPNGGEHYWSCTAPGVITVDGTLMCEDHAGERGYGPKQAEYGFDPDDGLNPTPVCGCTNPDYTGVPCGEGWR